MSIPVSALFAMLLMLHPVWSAGVIGQFYGDRLFIGPAFVLCCLLFTRRFDSPWLIPLSILLTLTSERTGFIAGALLIGAIVLSHPTQPTEWWRRRSLVATGLLCMVFSAVMVSTFNEHPHYTDYRQSLTIESFLAALRDYPGFAEKLWTFVEVNLIAWGLPAIASGPGMLLSVGAMLPNIIGNYGGAEKTGFVFHYHVLYFPALAAALCVSFVYLHRRFPRWVPWLVMAWLAIAGFAYNLNTNAYDFAFADLASRSFSYPFKGYEAERGVVDQRRELAAYMDQFPNTRVSTNEGLMPIMARHHSIAYYPLGIEDSDYVVIPKSPGSDAYAGAYSYLGAEELQKINECLNRTLIEKGYRVQKEFSHAVVLARRKG